MSTTENQQTQKDIDLISKGMEIVRLYESNVEPQNSWQKNGVLYLKKSDPKTTQRINVFRINDKANLTDWAMGKGIVASLGLRALVDQAMASSMEDRKLMADALPTFVSKIQSELQQLSSSLDISKFSVQKEITKIVTQLDAALQTGLLILNPALGEAKAQPVRLHEPTTESINIYIKQIRDISFYINYLKTKEASPELDDFAAATLRWLADDWQKSVGAQSAVPANIQDILHQAQIVFLKIAFEARQLFRTRPLYIHLGLINPHFKKSLAIFLVIKKKINELLEVNTRDISREHATYLKNAQLRLQQVVQEAETFLNTLPKSPKEAEKYYAEFKLSMPEKLVPSQKKAEQKQPKHRKKGDTVFSRIGFKIPFFLLLSLSIYVSTNWVEVTRILMFWRGSGIGSDYGVTKVTVSDNHWVGVLDMVRWNRIDDKEKLSIGSKFIEALLEHDFSDITLMDDHGNIVAYTIYHDGSPIWRVEGVGVMDPKKKNELKSYMPK